MSTVGFAIVGLGSIADFHAEAIRQVDGAELRAVTSRDPVKTAAFAAKQGADPCPSLEALLARTDVDVLCVTTPSGAHAEVAVPALRAGKHVLCEKPLEVSIEACESMIQASLETRRTLAAVFQARFGSGARALKKAVDEGRFGQITLASAYVKWWRDDAYYSGSAWRGTWKLDGGGALMNQGIHAVDLLQWLVGMPDEVFAFAGSPGHAGLEVEDTVVAALQFPNGAMGVIEAATSCHPGVARRVEIAGTGGFVILEDDRPVKWEFREARDEDEAIRAAAANPGIGGGAGDPRAISVEGHRAQVADLVHVVRTGGAPAIPASDATNAIRLILSIYASARSGSRQSL